MGMKKRISHIDSKENITKRFVKTLRFVSAPFLKDKLFDFHFPFGLSFFFSTMLILIIRYNMGECLGGIYLRVKYIILYYMDYYFSGQLLSFLYN